MLIGENGLINMSYDIVFKEVMYDEKIVALFLRELLGIEFESVEFVDHDKEESSSGVEVSTEKAVSHLTGSHGVCLDILAKGKNGTLYDIEMQKIQQREASYACSLLPVWY